MKKPVIMEKISDEWYLWKVFLYFPTEEQVKRVLAEEKKFFPEKNFCFSYAEVVDF